MCRGAKPPHEFLAASSAAAARGASLLRLMKTKHGARLGARGSLCGASHPHPLSSMVPKQEKPWLWSFVEQFWAGLGNCEGRGRRWETSRSAGPDFVLERSWGDAFVE